MSLKDKLRLLTRMGFEPIHKFKLMYTHDVDTGSLFKNEHKTEEKHPDYKGTINQDGKLRDVALWLRSSKDGKTSYFFMKTTDKQEKAPQTPQNQGNPGNDFSSAKAKTNDLPF